MSDSTLKNRFEQLNTVESVQNSRADKDINIIQTPKNDSIFKNVQEGDLAFTPIARASQLFNWKKYIINKTIEVRAPEFEIRLNNLETVLGQLLYCQDMTLQLVAKIDSQTLELRINQIIDFFKRVKVYNANESNLEIYKAEFVFNQTYTQLNLVIDGIRRYSSVFYRAIQNASENHFFEVGAKLMAIDAGHVINLTFKQDELKVNQEKNKNNIIFKNLRQKQL